MWVQVQVFIYLFIKYTLMAATLLLPVDTYLA